MARAGHSLPVMIRPGHIAAFLDLAPRGPPLDAGVGCGQYQATRLLAPEIALVMQSTPITESDQ